MFLLVMCLKEHINTYMHYLYAGTQQRFPVAVSLGGLDVRYTFFFCLARLAAGQNFFFDFERISFHVMNAYSGMYALSMVIYWSECECQRELYVRGMGYQVAVHRKQGVFRWRKFSGIVRTYPRVMRGNMEFVNRILLHRHDFYCYI